MATAIKLLAASPHIGSPVLMAVTPNVVKNATFHIVKMQVTSQLADKAGNTYPVARTYNSSKPVYTLDDGTESGRDVQINISSALLAAADDYVFTSEPTTYPFVGYKVDAWDEYMVDGVLYENQGKVSIGYDTAAPMRGIFGKLSDMERLLSSSTGRSNRNFSRKPTTMAEAVTVGSQYIYPTPFDTDPTPSTITTGPTSVAYDITKTGMQTVVGTRKVYGVKASVNRYEFRFINGFGVMESYSCKSLAEKNTPVSKTEYEVAIQEGFNTLQRGLLVKKNDIETWKMATDDMDESWMQWFVHEFAMASHAWVKVGAYWVPCHITPDDTIKMGSRKSSDPYSMEFSVKLDITGSPSMLV